MKLNAPKKMIKNGELDAEMYERHSWSTPAAEKETVSTCWPDFDLTHSLSNEDYLILLS